MLTGCGSGRSKCRQAFRHSYDLRAVTHNHTTPRIADFMWFLLLDKAPIPTGTLTVALPKKLIKHITGCYLHEQTVWTRKDLPLF